ncbi:hypothetical protein ACFL96_00460 [Thermoproteota archaeon]
MGKRSGKKQVFKTLLWGLTVLLLAAGLVIVRSESARLFAESIQLSPEAAILSSDTVESHTDLDKLVSDTSEIHTDSDKLESDTSKLYADSDASALHTDSAKLDGSVQEVLLDSPFIKTVVTYHNNFFGFTDQGRFVKRSLTGQVQWVIEKDCALYDLLGIKFGRVFFQDEKGRVEAYDSDYGFRVWVSEPIGITKFQFYYPYIILTDKHKRLRCLDFDSGLMLWQHHKSEFKDFMISRVNKVILAVFQDRIYSIDIVTGKIINKQILEHGILPNQLIGEDWEGAVILADKDNLYRYKKGLAQVTSMNYQSESMVLDGNTYVYLDSKSTVLTACDLKKSMQLWQRQIEIDQDIIYFFDNVTLIQSSESDMCLLDTVTGQVVYMLSGKYLNSASDIGPVLNIIKDDGQIWFCFSESIISVKL